MRLELGAGKRPQPGYTHQDLRPLDDIEIVCDARALPEDIKGQPTEIFAYHLLEHIPWREAAGTVRHWAEWLAPGGVLKVVGPDPVALAQWLLEEPHNDYVNDRVQYMMFGSQDYPENSHYCLTTLNLVERWFKAAELEIIETCRLNNRRPRGEHCPMISVLGQKPC